ncbi:MAG TPA: hypothetical protein VM888_14580 [Chitinophagaceae bacterium]|nr:hypothetical protein [Chitinophagaceae bacterium]
MDKLPLYVSMVFGITTLITIYLFYRATNNSFITLLIIIGWLVLQTAVSLSGFYTSTDDVPPRLLLLVMPPNVMIIVLLVTQKGRRYLDALNIKTLTLLHTVRIFVELVLYWLFVNKAVPELMTFEGRNFDIISGLTAPIVFFIAFNKNRIHRGLLLVWNCLCLLLLINIVVNAFLSAPFPFQQFAFDQPNVAILYFPFVWLPGSVVPIVLLSHIAAIRQLVNKREVT